MKKLTIIGLILAIMAVGVFLACAGVSSKDASGSKYIKIRINTETGELISVKDQSDKDARQLTPAELQQLYQNQAPLEIGKILFTQSSPGCITVVMLGWPFQICS